MLSRRDMARLRRHHYQTVGLFVALLVCAVFAAAAHETLALSERTRDSLIGTLGGGLIVALMLQFRCRCPSCRANLGWQGRPGIPGSCRRCGVRLR